MSKYIKIQENIYNTFLALKSRKRQQEFLEKCFIYAWEGREIDTKDSVVSIAFLGVKPSLKISETSSNWGGLRENSGRKNNQVDNQDDNQVDYQDEIKSKSSPFISNKDISNKNTSNKNISTITKDNNCYQMLSNDNKNNNKIKENKIKENKINTTQEDKNDSKWTDLDRWEKGLVDKDKYRLCYKGIVPIDWEPTEEDYEATQGSPFDISGLQRRYRFEGNIIKLTPNDFEKWRKEFNRLNLEDELYGLDSWAVKTFEEKDKKNWFWVIHGLLVKKQREEIKKNPDRDKYWL